MKKLSVTFAGLIVGAFLLVGANTLSVASISSPPKAEVSGENIGVTNQRIAHYYGCRWVRRCMARDRFGNCLKSKRFWVCPRGWR